MIQCSPTSPGFAERSSQKKGSFFQKPQIGAFPEAVASEVSESRCESNQFVEANRLAGAYQRSATCVDFLKVFLGVERYPRFTLAKMLGCRLVISFGI
jgi:hypothetical protein